MPGPDTDPTVVTDPLDATVAAWRSVLGTDDVDDSTHFFRNGGTSIKAAMLIARLRKATGVRVPMQAFLKDPTPRAVAALLSGGLGATPAGRAETPVGDPVEAAVRTLREAVEQGQVLGAQLFAARGGDTVTDVAIGRAGDDEPMTTGSRFRWYCAGKPVVAVACATLVDDRALDWQATLASYLPELGAAPAGRVTVAQVLNSSSGIPEVDALEPAAPALAALTLTGEPGTVPYYSYHTGWQVLRILIERITGEDVSAYVRRRVLRPLGMDGTDLEPIGATGGRPRVGQPMLRDGAWVPVAEEWINPHTAGALDTGRALVGPAHDLAALYLELRRALRGEGRLLRRSTAREMLARSRGRSLDRNTGQWLDIGLGLQLNLTDVLACERFSGESLGHLGIVTRPTALGLYDPAHDTVVTILLRGDAAGNQVLMTEVLDRLLTRAGPGRPG